MVSPRFLHGFGGFAAPGRGLLDAAWWLPDAGPLEEGARRGVTLWQAELTPCELGAGNGWVNRL